MQVGTFVFVVLFSTLAFSAPTTDNAVHDDQVTNSIRTTTTTEVSIDGENSTAATNGSSSHASAERIMDDLWTTLKSRKRRTTSLTSRHSTDDVHGSGHGKSGHGSSKTVILEGSNGIDASNLAMLDGSGALGNLHAQFVPAGTIETDGIAVEKPSKVVGDVSGGQQVFLSQDQMEMLIKNLVGGKMTKVPMKQNMTGAPVAVIFSSSMHVIDFMNGKNLSFLTTPKPHVKPTKESASGFIKIWGLLPFSDGGKRPSTTTKKPFVHPEVKIPTHKPINMSGIIDNIFKPFFAKPAVVSSNVQTIQQIPVPVQQVPVQQMPVMMVMAQPQFASFPQFQQMSLPAHQLPDVSGVLQGVMNAKKEILKDALASASAHEHAGVHDHAGVAAHATVPEQPHKTITIIKTKEVRDMGEAPSTHHTVPPTTVSPMTTIKA